MFKAKFNMLPDRLREIFSINKSNTRQAGLFKPLYKRTKIRAMCISSIIVNLWNFFNIELRNIKTVK